MMSLLRREPAWLASFRDFINDFKVRNKATSNKEICHVLSFLSSNGIGICLTDRLFGSDVGIVNLHPTK